MNSDDLGEVGQDHFKLLCSRTGLTCNPVLRDRTGWDFLVEFPFEDQTNDVPLDRRQQPLQVWVQVKAVWEGNESVSLRLSSAERLAKLEAPALIVCPVISRTTTEVCKIFSVHILDEALGKILQAVRQCEANDGLKINRKYVGFDFKNFGVEVELSPDALRDYMLIIGGPKRASYADEKRRQIEGLGFLTNPYPFSGSFTLEAESEEELQDVFLGLKAGKLKSFSAVEKRFGIQLPLHVASGPGEIWIRPNPINSVLTLRGTSLRDVLRLRAGVIAVPVQDQRGNNKKVKLVVKLELIDLIFQKDEDIFTIQFQYIDKNIISLRDYLQVVDIQRLLVGGCQLELETAHRPTLKADLSPEKDDDAIRAFTFWHRLLSEFKVIVEAAGLSPTEVSFDTDELGKQELGVRLLHELLEGNSGVHLNKMHFKPNSQLTPDLSAAEILVAGRITMGESSIVFFATANGLFTHSSERFSMAAEHLVLRRVEFMSSDTETFQRFCDEARAETGLSLIITWLSGSFLLSRDSIADDKSA